MCPKGENTLTPFTDTFNALSAGAPSPKLPSGAADVTSLSTTYRGKGTGKWFHVSTTS